MIFRFYENLRIIRDSTAIIDVSTSGYDYSGFMPQFTLSLYPCFKTENLIENSSQRATCTINRK